MSLIYHMAAGADWRAAQAGGSYVAASLEAEGFLHCSTAAQVVPVSNAFLKGQSGLVLLCIDPEKLTSELKWEAPAHPNPGAADKPSDEQLFPHIYGPLNTDAVVAAVAFEPGADGTFAFPEDAPRN